MLFDFENKITAASSSAFVSAAAYLTFRSTRKVLNFIMRNDANCIKVKAYAHCGYIRFVFVVPPARSTVFVSARISIV